MALRPVEDSLDRLRLEFLSVPRRSLSAGEAARLLNVDPVVARDLLHALEAAHFLERTWDGRFIRTPTDSNECALCGHDRVKGTFLKVANTDHAEVMWVCTDCQHKLSRGLDDEGVKGG